MSSSSNMRIPKSDILSNSINRPWDTKNDLPNLSLRQLYLILRASKDKKIARAAKGNDAFKELNVDGKV